jgi:multidrug efflux pump
MLISDFCISRPAFAIVINLVLALLGVAGLQKLAIRQLPEIDTPTVSVITSYPGASPEQVERQVTTPIEEAVGSIPGIDQITSESRRDTSFVQVAFQFGQDAAAAANEMRAKVSGVLDQLPAGIQPPVVAQQSIDAVPIMFLAFSSASMSALEVSDLVRRRILPQLATVPGIAQSQLTGERRYAMRIELFPLNLAAFDITVEDVVNAVRQQNSEIPGGQIRTASTVTDVLASTTLAEPDAFADIVLKSSNGSVVQLRDVGRIRVAPEDTTSSIRFNGRDAVAVGIVPQSTANPIEIAAAIRAMVPTLQQVLPAGIGIDVAFDASIYMQASVDEVYRTIAITVVLVILVVVLFLGSLRSSVITLVAIPLSLVGTGAFMYLAGFSLNIFTLLAVVLAIGLVVDDAIVEVENVQRHIDAGIDPIQASFLGSREIGFAVIATTLTLASVYAPVGLLGGQVGQLFREFAFTLAATIIISGFIARTLSPMMCSRILRPKSARSFGARVDRALGAASRRYGRLLQAALRHPWLALLVAAVVTGLGLAAAQRLPFELAPPEDQGYLMIRLEGPPTATLDYLEQESAALERVFADVPERRSSLVVVGSPSPNQVLAFLILRDWRERQRSAAEIGQAMLPALKQLAGSRASILDADPLGGQSGPAVQVLVKTTGSYDELRSALETLLERSRTIRGFVDPKTDLVFDSPQLRVEIDRARAADLGVAVDAIGQTLSAFFGDHDVSRFTWSGELYNAIVEMRSDLRGDPDAIDRIYVRAAGNRIVPLGQLVELERTVGPTALKHAGQLRSAGIEGGVAPGYGAGQVLTELEQIARTTLPSSMQLDYGGAARVLRQSSGSAGTVLGMSLLFIYLVLSAQFESFRDPAIILAVVPFTIAGALLGLAAAGGSLNLYSFIGFITLIGLIAKHGILITEFANQQRDEGQPFGDAVLRAAETRFRPILMTTVAMVLGALPLALATGAGAGGRRQIGIVICAGLTIGTLFSLFVIPVVYSLLSRKRRVPPVRPDLSAGAAAATPATGP